MWYWAAVAWVSAQPTCSSDHHLVTCRLRVSWNQPTVAPYQYRDLRRLDLATFQSNILQLLLHVLDYAKMLNNEVPTDRRQTRAAEVGQRRPSTAGLRSTHGQAPLSTLGDWSDVIACRSPPHTRRRKRRTATLFRRKSSVIRNLKVLKS